jgi:hypothetical protein
LYWCDATGGFKKFSDVSSHVASTTSILLKRTVPITIAIKPLVSKLSILRHELKVLFPGGPGNYYRFVEAPKGYDGPSGLKLPKMVMSAI